MKRDTLSHGPHAWCPSSRGGKGLYEEACAVVPQAGLCEGEALGSAGSNTVTLPKPKGGSKRGTQSRPKHCTRPLYSTQRSKENPRNRKHTKRGRKRLFNAVINALRMHVERTFAWEDKFKRLLLRFERIQQRHYGTKLMAYTLINLRAFCGV